MTKESNNATAAAGDGTADPNLDDAEPKTAAEGSLAPHALPSGELEAEDLAVLPGHGKSGSAKRVAPAAALLALLALGVYSFTRGGAPAPQEPPQAAAQPAPVAAAPVAKAPAKPEPKPTPSETVDENAPSVRRGLPMMMPPPAEESVAEAPDLGPGGPSVGRFPDLPPSVISYLKRMETVAKEQVATTPEPEPADTPAEP